MWSPSYGCFSTGMCDDCVKTLIDWQEGPFRLLSAVLNTYLEVLKAKVKP